MVLNSTNHGVDEKMRVALTNPYCWPHVTRGSEAMMHGLASWLRANDHDASIVAGHSIASTYLIDNVPCQTVRSPDLRGVHRELGPSVTMIPALARALRKLSPDIVHAFCYQDAFAAKLARLPYVISYAGIITPRSWRNARWQFRLFNAASRGARAIITPSLACASALEKDYGFSSDQIIPYALDVAPFVRLGVSRVPGRILSTATPDDSRKRPQFLVAAFGKIADSMPEAHLVFCGEASDGVRRKLLDLLPQNHRRRVSFLGNLRSEELKDEYAKATVSALTSVNEAFGLVIVESLAAGTPVVGTHSGAIPELVDETVGGTFDVDDVDGCAKLLLRVMQADPVRYPSACMERAHNYDWSVVCPRILSVYQCCLKPAA